MCALYFIDELYTECVPNNHRPHGDKTLATSSERDHAYKMCKFMSRIVKYVAAALGLSR